MTMYPTEVITLPSQGKYYPEEHPIKKSGGNLEIKHMTAKEEDILTSTNLIRKGLAMAKFLDSIIVHDGVGYEDLSSNDIVAVMIASRVLAYGKDYDVTVVCDRCGHETTEVVDLSQMETPDDLVEPNFDGTLTFTLPTGRTVTIRVLTRGQEIQIEQENERIEKSGLPVNLVTSRLKKIIVELDGVTKPDEISNLVENMIVADSREIRKQYEKITPNIDTTVEIPCSNCENIIGGELPITAKFFWPDL